MRLKIQHDTVYDYHRSVGLNPHNIYLKPLPRNYLEISNYDLQIQPEPEGLNERYSIEGNPYFQVWFSGETNMLSIKVSFESVHLAFNPFLFLVDQWFIDRLDLAAEIPFQYQDDDLPILRAYMEHSNNPLLRKYGRDKLTGPDPIQFITELTAAIHADWRHIIREEENLWPASKTFAAGRGSCRDLSWMLIEILRHQGLAARFVSGYAYNPELDEGHELHAWVEAFLPGAGWVGMDPSLGLMTDEHYIPLACSFRPGNTLPVHGTYGGENLRAASLSAYVRIEAF
ncbi:Transglutaminase-like enzyme, putative cysteine protease [Cyclobacterium lianum]|uniref:Transglutaminase-like enzyme, putative cysteine protease n=1 Tax=Cyclobacterium lianum TaxID=388280 RepID=A0A1M7NAA7_9BACT|nr:transglutaminase family protein [Cyclobacterium lianum]SHN00596.1 Transglutaminase-like enzyme, putative cysteine protease [Cyclobacterium lianum]